MGPNAPKVHDSGNFWGNSTEKAPENVLFFNYGSAIECFLWKIYRNEKTDNSMLI